MPLPNLFRCHCHSSSSPQVKRSDSARAPETSSPDFTRWLTLTTLMALLLTAQPATAQQATVQQATAAIAAGDTLRVTVDSNVKFDSNVFRLSPSIDPVVMTGQPTRSDRIITSTASLKFNKPYSLQRFELDASVVDNRYDNFNFLNFTAFNYGGAWRWNLTPYLYGNLSGNHREALNNFANLSGFANSTNRNLRIEDNLRFDGVFEIDGAWRIIGGIAQESFKNSQVFVQNFDTRTRSVEGGIRYAFPSGSSLTYKLKRGWGEFLNRPQPLASSLFDNRFTDLEHEIRLIWPVTGKTSIDARAAHFERKHAHFPQRDFSGFVGNFNLNWAITGKTRLTASWSHDLSNFQIPALDPGLLANFQRFSSNYIASDRFSLAPAWQINAKTALRLRYDYIMQDFLGTAAATSFASRSDTLQSGLIALDWQPVNALFLSATLQHDRRSSNLTGFDFTSSAASVTARVNF